MSQKRAWNVYSKTRQNIAIGLLAVIVVILGIYALEIKPAREQARAQEMSASQATAQSKPTATNKPAAVEPAITVSSKAVALGSKVVIFGDSWTQGYAANPNSHGYAYLVSEKLGWETAVFGLGGTGYVNPGPGAKASDYVTRTKALNKDMSVDLVLIQGSINDLEVGIDGLPSATAATFDNVQRTYPSAEIIVLGPAPAYLPVPEKLSNIDKILEKAATEAKAAYISPLEEKWITAKNYAEIIDTSATNHPGPDGHKHLAEMLERAIEKIPKS